jgi:hypothetical protein
MPRTAAADNAVRTAVDLGADTVAPRFSRAFLRTFRPLSGMRTGMLSMPPLRHHLSMASTETDRRAASLWSLCGRMRPAAPAARSCRADLH